MDSRDCQISECLTETPHESAEGKRIEI